MVREEIDGTWGPIVIGPRQIYEQVVLLRQSVDRLLLHDAEWGEKFTDHETRLRALERGRWPLPALAVIVSSGSLIVSVFLR